LADVKQEIEESTNKLFEMLGELSGTTDEAQEELQKFMNVLNRKK